MRSKRAGPEMTVASSEQEESAIGVIQIGPEAGPLEDARGRIYAFLAALFSHPDTGKWGRVLNADEQRLAIATADALRARACGMKYRVLADELPGRELDLRFLVVELCQPLGRAAGQSLPENPYRLTYSRESKRAPNYRRFS